MLDQNCNIAVVPLADGENHAIRRFWNYFVNILLITHSF